MSQSARKFAGVWALIAILVAYPLFVAVMYATYLMELPVWASLLFFLVTGLFWAVPAGLVIRWMSKPDAPENG
ncbi:MAG: DUF2842 domain-containing protein [Hyphomicrobiaceae bacterium]|nr:DUF2842 domain-containing protein [Hyphomicrobiaceae bacterium]